MKTLVIGIFVLSLCLSGCSWFKSPQSSKRINPDDLVIKLEDKDSIVINDFLKEGNIIDQMRFKKGGSVIVIPFSPGVNIEANDEFDRLTLRMIRGIMDEFSKDESKFDFVTSENADEADLIIEGRVTEIQKPSMMKSMTLKHNRRLISVQGKLIDRESEKSIVVFSDTVEALNKNETLELLGTKIGHHIGHFIVTGGVTK